MAKKKIDYDAIKNRFNDVVMRELGLGITEDDYIYDMDTETILQIKEKFIKYCEYGEGEVPYLKHNEIEMNLLENPRLTETISFPYLYNYCERKGVTFHTISQVPADDGTDMGRCILSYISSGQAFSVESDMFSNEAVRVFNLITKVNKTSHLYKFEDFDIKIPKKK